jgi:hypothetical protein
MTASEEIREVDENGTTIVLGGDVISGCFFSVVGLPEPTPGVVYVVARPLAVALAMSGQARPDVAVVDRLVRDDKGTIIGASGFARIVSAPIGQDER